ncbi:MAG: hypothetical protein ACRCSQ_01005 [Bacteroidales bacterium]
MIQNEKRRCGLTILLTATVLTAGAQMYKLPEHNNEAFRCDLKGPVKSQTLTVVVPTGTANLRDVGVESYILEEKYNPQQFRTVENLSNTENVLIAKSEILQDRNGYATEVIYTDLFGNMMNRITYEYEANKNWKRTVNYDAYYNPLGIYYYYYTPEGNLSEVRKTDEGGIQEEKAIFVYDETGNLAQQINFDGKDKQTGTTEFLYNRKNRVISYRTLAGEDSIRIYAEANYANDTLLTDMTLEYYTDNKPTESILYLFDPLGNILKTVRKDLTGTKPEEIKEYLYEWDLHGNWTKQLIKKDGDVEVAASRSITYYPAE